MSNRLDVLWLNANPSLQCLDRQLLLYLSKKVLIAQWEYLQNQDEPSLLDEAVLLVHEYLKSRDRPVHLIGHSTGGLLGLLYARRYPEAVKSLTLLAVGVRAAVNWQAHYYMHRHLFYSSRECILTNMVYNLFGYQNRRTTKCLVKVLQRDLDCSLSPHSLFKQISVPSGGVSVPLLVCGSHDDIVVDRPTLQGWRTWLKSSDRLWECPRGGHFFHHFYPQCVGEQIFDFWQVA